MRHRLDAFEVIYGNGYGAPTKFFRLACDVPHEFDTIESALAASVSSQTVNIDSIYVGTDDITIPDTSTIHFTPNATLLMPDDTKLLVYGKITADSATFTLASGETEWRGIQIQSGADTTSRLANCIIEKADKGVSIYNSGTTIDSCEISDCTYGIYINTSSDAVPIINNCKVIDNSYGVVNYNSDAQIKYCDLSNSVLDFGNSGSTTAPLLEHCDFQGGYGVYNVSGNTFLGDNLEQMGYNNFVVPTYPDYAVRTNNPYTVKAETNYWGADNPSASYFSGAVDYDPWSNEPNSAGTLWKTIPSSSLIARGMSAYRNGDYEEAVNTLIFEDVLSVTNGAHYLFYGFKAAYKAGLLEDVLQRNSGLDTCKNFQVQHTYSIWKIKSLAESGSFSKALTFIKARPQAEQFELLLDVSRIAWERGELPQAKNILSMARADFKGQENFERRIWDVEHLFEMPPPNLTKNISEDRILQNTIKDFDLVLAYPNPFNPSTTIMFNLSSEQFVDLAVYNMLGQKIKGLCDARLQAGVHNISWNGTNERGIPVASGVYYVGLQTHQQIQTIKVLFLK